MDKRTYRFFLLLIICVVVAAGIIYYHIVWSRQGNDHMGTLVLQEETMLQENRGEKA